MASGPITSWEIDGETVDTVSDFIFGGSQITQPASWETCLQVKKQQLEPDMEQWTGSKLGKGTSKLYMATLLI